jgi:hypothetical protein
MYCNPTITAEEFKTVHNGLCELESAIRRLEDVINPELFKSLARGASEIRRGLAGAYEQDNTEGDRKFKHYEDVGQQLGMTNSVWSIYKAGDLCDRHPYEDADRVVYKDHWGEKPVGCSINGLTWAALWIAANACIRDSGDCHHIYIESFHPDKNDPRTLILQTGS